MNGVAGTYVPSVPQLLRIKLESSGTCPEKIDSKVHELWLLIATGKAEVYFDPENASHLELWDRNDRNLLSDPSDGLWRCTLDSCFDYLRSHYPDSQDTIHQWKIKAIDVSWTAENHKIALVSSVTTCALVAAVFFLHLGVLIWISCSQVLTWREFHEFADDSERNGSIRLSEDH